MNNIYSMIYEIKKTDNSIILILNEINDPRNLGSCLRCAFGAGVYYVILTIYKSCPINETVIHTSSGYSNNLNIIRVRNINKILNILKENNIYVVGTSLNKNSSIIYNINFNRFKYIALIIGSENNGIPNKIINKCNISVKIPMINKIDSLNLSVATGICLFEIIRQKLFK